jgi:hypothetical protein
MNAPSNWSFPAGAVATMSIWSLVCDELSAGRMIVPTPSFEDAFAFQRIPWILKDQKRRFMPRERLRRAGFLLRYQL